MPLPLGTRLGPYEINSPLGAGGMGEVYRARDTRLERDVAVKVLPQGLAGSELLRARLEREAKSISALNHPHICTLFDVGHQDGVMFLVMELIEGESLADRLTRGALPPDQVLRYGAQIAEALDHAHRLGIVHRDLKPANVMLTKSGAKLLDFGLARTAAEAPAPLDGLTSHPTQVKPLTQEGMIVGTFQYMAPEQLEAQALDARTDIFALGAVLYEMATGRRAFEGKNRASLIAAIVSSHPPAIATVVPVAPPALDHVVKRCLEKEPDDRWHSAHDVAGELRWISEAGSQAGVAAPVTLRRKSRERLAWILAGVMTIGAIAAVAMRRESGPGGQDIVRSVIPVAAASGQAEVFGTLAISPDGRTVAWLDSDGGRRQVYLRRLDEPEPHALTGTEQAQQIFFSPDSRWLGFFADGKLQKAPVGGGAPVTIARAVLPRGASWGDDDSIVFVPFYYGGVERISATGGNREVLTTPDRDNGELAHRWPHLLPGGKAFLYTIGTGGNWDDAKIAVQAVDSKERRIVIEGGYDGRYLPTGHLVYSRGESLYAVRFDLETLAASGDPVQVLEGVGHGDAGAAEYSFSRDGRLIYRPAGSLQGYGGALRLVDRSGRDLPFRDPVPSGQWIRQPRVSPAGDHLAGAIGWELWNLDLVRGASTRLTSGTRATDTIWSPDGRVLAFSQERKNPWNPYVRRADGSEPEEILMKKDTPLTPTSWSPDGAWILMSRIDPETATDLLSFSVGDRSLKPFVVTEHNESAAVFSPDGKWVAYNADDSGRYEIYVRSFAGAEGRWQISTEGASEARWKKPDEIIFQSGRKMLSVHVTTSPVFSADPPRLLFEGPSQLADLMPDGNRILVQTIVESGSSNASIHLVTHWFSEVAEKTRS